MQKMCYVPLTADILRSNRRLAWKRLKRIRMLRATYFLRKRYVQVGLRRREYVHVRIQEVCIHVILLDRFRLFHEIKGLCQCGRERRRERECVEHILGLIPHLRHP
jgi:hypothetical protein